MLFVVCCILCSGCIADGNNGKTPSTSTVAPTTTPPMTTVAPTTSPPTSTVTPTSEYLFPKYAHQLHEEIDEKNTACETAMVEWQRALDAFRIMAQSPESGEDELYRAYSNYDAAIREYERMIMKYYSALLLSEHTEPTESGLLALKKDTVPFDRPDGQTYTYGVLNMGGEGYMANEGKIQLCIRYGVRGQGLLEAIDSMEEYLPEYHDIITGYVYHEMSRYLTCLSLYSDGLVDDIESCNPPLPL